MQFIIQLVQKKKAQKKEDFSVLEKFVTYLIQSHGYGYFIFYVSKQYL